MKNFQPQRRRNVIWNSKLFLIILGVFMLFFTWNLIGFLGKLNDTKRNEKIAEDKVVELREAKAKLGADISKLSTEEGVEENIREKFGLAKEGEGLIVIVDEKDLPKDKSKEKKGFINWVKNLLK